MIDIVEGRDLSIAVAFGDELLNKFPGLDWNGSNQLSTEAVDQFVGEVDDIDELKRFLDDSGYQYKLVELGKDDTGEHTVYFNGEPHTFKGYTYKPNEVRFNIVLPTPYVED